MNRAFVILAGAVLLLLPFFCNPYGFTQELQLGAPKLFAVFLLGNFALAIVFGRGIHWFFGVAHFLLSAECVLTGFGPTQLYPYAYWLTAAGFSLWFVHLHPSLRKWLWWAMIAGGICSTLFAFLQVFGHDPIFHYNEGIDPTLPIAFFGQQTKFGAYLAPLASLSFWFPGGWVIFIAMSAICVTTGSSFTMAALLAGFLVNIRWWRPIRARAPALIAGIFAMGVILAIGLCKAFPEKELFFAHGRYEIWAATWDAWAHHDHVLLGYGPGAFMEIFAGNFQPESTRSHGAFLQAHNDYLQLIFDCGIPGIVILLAAAYSIGRAFWRGWWNYGFLPPAEMRGAQAYLVAILVNAIGNFPFQLSPHYFFAIMCLAIVLKDDQETSIIYEWPLPTSSV
jgi:O-antigen ligase